MIRKVSGWIHVDALRLVEPGVEFKELEVLLTKQTPVLTLPHDEN